MENHTYFTSDEEIHSIARGLMDRTLPRSARTHAAHFATALWLLASRPEAEVSQLMPGLIRAYNEASGTANTDTSGYHETITQASIRAARHFMEERGSEPLFATCNALMASSLGKSDWLLAYWSRARLFSVEARKGWVDADLEEFPF